MGKKLLFQIRPSPFFFEFLSRVDGVEEKSSKRWSGQKRGAMQGASRRGKSGKS